MDDFLDSLQKLVNSKRLQPAENIICDNLINYEAILPKTISEDIFNRVEALLIGLLQTNKGELSLQCSVRIASCLLKLYSGPRVGRTWNLFTETSKKPVVSLIYASGYIIKHIGDKSTSVIVGYTKNLLNLSINFIQPVMYSINFCFKKGQRELIMDQSTPYIGSNNSSSSNSNNNLNNELKTNSLNINTNNNNLVNKTMKLALKGLSYTNNDAIILLTIRLLRTLIKTNNHFFPKILQNLKQQILFNDATSPLIKEEIFFFLAKYMMKDLRRESKDRMKQNKNNSSEKNVDDFQISESSKNLNIKDRKESKKKSTFLSKNKSNKSKSSDNLNENENNSKSDTVELKKALDVFLLKEISSAVSGTSTNSSSNANNMANSNNNVSANAKFIISSIFHKFLIMLSPKYIHENLMTLFDFILKNVIEELSFFMSLISNDDRRKLFNKVNCKKELTSSIDDLYILWILSNDEETIDSAAAIAFQMSTKREILIREAALSFFIKLANLKSIEFSRPFVQTSTLFISNPPEYYPNLNREIKGLAILAATIISRRPELSYEFRENIECAINRGLKSTKVIEGSFQSAFSLMTVVPSNYNNITLSSDENYNSYNNNILNKKILKNEYFLLEDADKALDVFCDFYQNNFGNVLKKASSEEEKNLIISNCNYLSSQILQFIVRFGAKLNNASRTILLVYSNPSNVVFSSLTTNICILKCFEDIVRSIRDEAKRNEFCSIIGKKLLSLIPNCVPPIDLINSSIKCPMMSPSMLLKRVPEVTREIPKIFIAAHQNVFSQNAVIILPKILLSLPKDEIAVPFINSLITLNPNIDINDFSMKSLLILSLLKNNKTCELIPDKAIEYLFAALDAVSNSLLLSSSSNSSFISSSISLITNSSSSSNNSNFNDLFESSSYLTMQLICDCICLLADQRSDSLLNLVLTRIDEIKLKSSTKTFSSSSLSASSTSSSSHSPSSSSFFSSSTLSAQNLREGLLIRKKCFLYSSLFCNIKKLKEEKIITIMLELNNIALTTDFTAYALFSLMVLYQQYMVQLSLIPFTGNQLIFFFNLFQLTKSLDPYIMYYMSQSFNSLMSILSPEMNYSNNNSNNSKNANMISINTAKNVVLCFTNSELPYSQGVYYHVLRAIYAFARDLVTNISGKPTKETFPKSHSISLATKTSACGVFSDYAKFAVNRKVDEDFFELLPTVFMILQLTNDQRCVEFVQTLVNNFVISANTLINQQINQPIKESDKSKIIIDHPNNNIINNEFNIDFCRQRMKEWVNIVKLCCSVGNLPNHEISSVDSVRKCCLSQISINLLPILYKITPFMSGCMDDLITAAIRSLTQNVNLRNESFTLLVSIMDTFVDFVDESGKRMLELYDSQFSTASKIAFSDIAVGGTFLVKFLMFHINDLANNINGSVFNCFIEGLNKYFHLSSTNNNNNSNSNKENNVSTNANDFGNKRNEMNDEEKSAYLSIAAQIVSVAKENVSVFDKIRNLLPNFLELFSDTLKYTNFLWYPKQQNGKEEIKPNWNEISKFRSQFSEFYSNIVASLVWLINISHYNFSFFVPNSSNSNMKNNNNSSNFNFNVYCNHNSCSNFDNPIPENDFNLPKKDKINIDNNESNNGFGFDFNNFGKTSENATFTKNENSVIVDNAQNVNNSENINTVNNENGNFGNFNFGDFNDKMKKNEENAENVYSVDNLDLISVSCISDFFLDEISKCQEIWRVSAAIVGLTNLTAFDMIDSNSLSQILKTLKNSSRFISSNLALNGNNSRSNSYENINENENNDENNNNKENNENINNPENSIKCINNRNNRNKNNMSLYLEFLQVCAKKSDNVGIWKNVCDLYLKSGIQNILVFSNLLNNGSSKEIVDVCDVFFEHTINFIYKNRNNSSETIISEEEEKITLLSTILFDKICIEKDGNQKICLFLNKILGNKNKGNRNINKDNITLSTKTKFSFVYRVLKRTMNYDLPLETKEKINELCLNNFQKGGCELMGYLISNNIKNMNFYEKDLFFQLFEKYDYDPNFGISILQLCSILIRKIFSKSNNCNNNSNLGLNENNDRLILSILSFSLVFVSESIEGAELSKKLVSVASSIWTTIEKNDKFLLKITFKKIGSEKCEKLIKKIERVSLMRSKRQLTLKTFALGKTMRKVHSYNTEWQDLGNEDNEKNEE